MMSSLPRDRALIVENDVEIASELKLFLEHEGYDATCVHDGESALAIISRECPFSLILLATPMPGLNGVDVLKRMYDLPCDAAVIMMSGQGSEEVAVECMRNGADDYIAKPFSMDDILQRIERARKHHAALMEKKRLEQEREDFATMLSHDLKNPMTAVIGSIDIIREGRLGPVNPEQADYMQAAIDSCNEVVAMIDNLLDLRRFEAGKMPLRLRRMDPGEILRKVAGQFGRIAEHDGIRLTLKFHTQQVLVEADPMALTRILGNLLGNSLKFTHEDGEIIFASEYFDDFDTDSMAIPPHVTLPEHFRKERHVLKVSVRDTGDGIPSHDLGLIFDRFTQSRSGHGRERGGAGLGLAFCRWAVESFHGIIWAESEETEGSEFIFLLPCVPA